jgi:hypothetical protein
VSVQSREWFEEQFTNISFLWKCLRELERYVESVEIVDIALLRSVIGRQLSFIEGLYYVVATDCYWVISESVEISREFDLCHVL